MQQSASPSPRPWSSRRFALAAGGVLVGAAALQAGLRAGLDRTDLPGPGGVKVLTALATGDLDRDGLTRLAAPLLALTDPLTAVEGVVALGALAMVAGAMLAARALAGRPAALLAGVVAATFGQGALSAVLLGPDAPATGLVWLGVGLAWWGARTGGPALAAVVVGVALGVAGAVVKINAAPALALLALTPLLVPSRRPAQLGGALVALGVGAALAVGLLPDDPTQQASAPADLSWGALRGGLDAILSLPDRQQPAATPLIQLAGLGLVGAALPGPRWGTRLVVAGIGIAAAAVAAVTVGDLLRPRYLMAAALPAIALAGALGGLPLRLVPAGWARGLAGAGLAAAVSLPLMADTLAYLHAWDARRVALVGTRPTTLPAPPAAWSRRYTRMTDLVLTDSSEVGAARLVAEAASAPPGGVATVPLRDAREFHLSAGASLAGRPYRVLEARRCCEGAPLDRCAADVVAALDGAGARLLLPRPVDRRMRVPRPHQAWWSALSAAAEAQGGLEVLDAWWLRREPTGAGGPLPCAPAAPAPGRPPTPPRGR